LTGAAIERPSHEATVRSRSVSCPSARRTRSEDLVEDSREKARVDGRTDDGRGDGLELYRYCPAQKGCGGSGGAPPI
jgi:hypothetical protein